MGRVSGWIALLLVLGTAPATAAESLFELSLEDLMDVPVSSPTLTPESINRTPAAITVFSREEIQRTGYDYLHELLNLVPGYQVARSGDGPFSVSARGRANSTESREILLLVDGVPRNDLYDGGASGYLDYFPLAAIERVEVVRGPGSALYGENAFTGVINVTSRRGQNEVAALAGHPERMQLHALGHGKLQRWQLDGFARAERDRGDTYNVPDSFGSGRIDVRDPVRNLDLGGTVGNADTRLSANLQRRYVEDFYYAETTSNEINEATADYAALHLEQQVNWLDVKSRLLAGWQQRDHEYWVQGTAAGALAGVSDPSSTAALAGRGERRITQWEAYWRNDWSPSADHSMQFGADWRLEKVDRSRLYTNYNLDQFLAQQFPVTYLGGFDFESLLSAEDSRRVLGAYLQYQQQLVESTRLTLSLRHDDYSDVDSRTSPRIGLVHALTEQQSLKLLYAEAFRAPTLLETGLGQYQRQAGNPDLDHEIVRTWDLIWLYDARLLVLTAGAFHNAYVDPIVIVQNGSTRTYANGASESSEGVELSSRWQPLPQLQLRAAFTRFTDLPESAFREADTLGSLLVDYSQGNWNLNVAAIHHSERVMLTPVTGQLLELDAYWQLTAKLLFDLGGGVQTWLQAKNALDADIETPAQGNRLTEGVPNRGRELGVGLLWRY